MGGIGLQEFFIILFAGLALRMYFIIKREKAGDERATGQTLLTTVGIVLVLITVRSTLKLSRLSLIL